MKPPNSERSSCKRILIVEDDAAMRRGLTDNFRTAGYDTVAVADGRLALAHLLSASFDLVVLDVMVPNVNGFEICRRVRERRDDPPIIMVTAKGREQDIVRGLETGADDYVTKPFGIAELMARCHRLMARGTGSLPAAKTSTVRQFAGWELCPAARRLTYRGVEISLTQREMDLLLHLCKHPDRVHTRGQLLDAIWGRSLIVGSRSVDRCVTTLRQKMRAAGAESSIQTVRGVGYRFDSSFGSRNDGDAQ